MPSIQELADKELEAAPDGADGQVEDGPPPAAESSPGIKSPDSEPEDGFPAGPGAAVSELQRIERKLKDTAIDASSLEDIIQEMQRLRKDRDRAYERIEELEAQLDNS